MQNIWRDSKLSGVISPASILSKPLLSRYILLKSYVTTIRAFNMSVFIIAPCISSISSTSHVAERNRPLSHSLSAGYLVSHTRYPPHNAASSVKSVVYSHYPAALKEGLQFHSRGTPRKKLTLMKHLRRQFRSIRPHTSRMYSND